MKQTFNNEIIFEYDPTVSKFTNKENLEQFTINVKEKEDISKLINYFSEDKNYHKLASAKTPQILLPIMIILKVIIVVMIFLTDFSVYKTGGYSEENNLKNNYSYKVIFGLAIIIYFLILIFFITLECLRCNIFKNISKTESEALMSFSSENRKNLLVLTAHKKKRIYLLRLFCVYNFKFVIKKNLGSNPNSENVLLINETLDKNISHNYDKFDETINSDSIDYHNMSN
jgi:hypothetical protein